MKKYIDEVETIYKGDTIISNSLFFVWLAATGFAIHLGIQADPKHDQNSQFLIILIILSISILLLVVVMKIVKKLLHG